MSSADLGTAAQKRSQGGSDFDQDQLVGLGRVCHEQTVAPFDRGRLVIASRVPGRPATRGGVWLDRRVPSPAYGQSAAGTRVRSEKGGIATGSLPVTRAATE